MSPQEFDQAEEIDDTEEGAELDTRSHYAKYEAAHRKYQNSAKGKAARKRYMESAKGKAARKRAQKGRAARIKEALQLLEDMS